MMCCVHLSGLLSFLIWDSTWVCLWFSWHLHFCRAQVSYCVGFLSVWVPVKVPHDLIQVMLHSGRNVTEVMPSSSQCSISGRRCCHWVSWLASVDSDYLVKKDVLGLSVAKLLFALCISESSCVKVLGGSVNIWLLLRISCPRLNISFIADSCLSKLLWWLLPNDYFLILSFLILCINK